MGAIILRLSGLALLPVALAAILCLMEKKEILSKERTWKKQVMIGLLFGMVAIVETEGGIAINGAVMNVRNAAPLTAGLVFGWPAGLLAGFIGGLERWLTPSGDFTRLACTIGTMMAGVIAAIVGKIMLDNKRSTWLLGLIVGVICEVLHMLLVFWTNHAEIQRAFDIVQVIAVPMIVANGLATMLAMLIATAIDRTKTVEKRATQNLAQVFQKWLMGCIVLAFAATFLLTSFFQTDIAIATTASTLKANILDVKKEILDQSNQNLLMLARRVAGNLPENATSEDLVWLSELYDITELNLINEDGKIVASTYPEFLDYHMASGSQSAAFLVLLSTETEFVQDYQPTSYDRTISRKYAGVALESGGFLQLGYDAAQFQQQISEQVRHVAQNRHIGEEGFVVLFDEQGIIVSDRDGNEGDNIGLHTDFVDMSASESKRFPVKPGVVFEGEIYEKPAYCMYTSTEGYYIVGTIARDEALYSRNAAVYMLAFMEVVVFAAVFVLIFYLVKRLVVRNIHKINRALEQIAGGNLEETVQVRDNAEFAALSDDINTTVTTLRHYIDEAEARFAKDLEIAKQIQHSALPSVFPPYPGRKDFSIYAIMDAAKEVGGDFYDFYLINDNLLAFIVADVSGKGIPGAMFMMTSKTLIKGYAESGLPVHDVFTQVNAKLCENNEAGMFVTAWMGILDLHTGLIRYANAGHNPPVIRHKDGSYTYLKGKVNFVLAGMEGVRYREQQLQLLPGDEICLYTDGITEAHNINKELFGEDRLLESLNGTAGMRVEEICQKVKADVDAFVGEADQFDDITMLCVRLNELEEVKMLTLEPTLDSVPQVAAFVEENLEKYETPMKLTMKLMVAVDEIYSNIVRYSGATTAQIRLSKDERGLWLEFRDNGKPYNPLEHEDPDITASAEERSIGGLGIFMVRKMMDSVEYMHKDGQNILTLVARI